MRIGGLDPASTWGVGPDVIGNALTFGAILGFLAAIFAGWLGGLLAPSRLLAARTVPVAPVVDAPVRTVDEETVVREPAPRRSGFWLLSSIGRKGGEPVDRHDHVDADGDREIHKTRDDT